MKKFPGYRIAAAFILCTFLLASCGLFGFDYQTTPPNETDAEIISEGDADPDVTTTAILHSVESDELISTDTEIFTTDPETEPLTETETSSETEICEETEDETSAETTAAVTEVEPETEPEPEYIGRIAITFDDGPTVSIMEQILDKCEESGAHVTFFLCGYKISSSSHEVMKRALELGCELGNHSNTHPNFNQLTTDAIKSEIDIANERIKEATGIDATLMRPPYGNLKRDIGRTLDKQFILWSVDPEDWKYRDTQTVYDNVLSRVGDGDIVLLHDLYKTSYEAFCMLVDELQEQGYKLVTVSELMESSGMPLVNGYFYYSSTYAK